MAKYKAMLKSELADAAGVSLSTFSSWLRSDQDFFRSLNIGKRAKYLPPRRATRCDKVTDNTPMTSARAHRILGL